jgi:hypothetical protein
MGLFGAKDVERSTGNGTIYQLHRKPGSRNSPPTLLVKLQTDQNAAFRITRENWFDRLGKNLGLSLEVETGDAEFDNSCYLDSDMPDFLARLLQNADVREAVRQILQAGFTEIRAAENNIHAAWRGCNRNPEDVGSEFDYVADNLRLIVQRFPNEQLILESAFASSSKMKRVSSLLLTAGVFAAALVLLASSTKYSPLDAKAMLVYSLSYSVPAAILICWAEIIWLRQRSSAHRDLLGILPFTLAAVLIGGYAVVSRINGGQDASPPAIHDAIVMEKYFTTSKSSRNYHAVLQSWRGNGQKENISISKINYDRLAPNHSHALVTTKAGKLGFEWITRTEFRF